MWDKKVEGTVSPLGGRLLMGNKATDQAIRRYGPHAAPPELVPVFCGPERPLAHPGIPSAPW